ncbi:hypothetical protein [Corallococcus sp. AB038B]|uniref:hypothetical protein n=1 Tax=Corallococcus sp. AB038B TaxID=2316718 RepID=UPI000EE68EEA|nr:hypothetical protein [Corallococcus sp. AB038B]RKH92978.1 hypothetical protein D7Y04_41895 [Corallococcus sp. AB038B]
MLRPIAGLSLFLFALSLPLPALAAAPKADAPAPATPAAEDSDRSIRTIPLNENKVGRVYRVKTSVGLPVVVEFPESFDVPVTCGDCAVEPPDSASPDAVAEFTASPAYFIVSPHPEQQFLALKPKQYPTSMGGSIPDEDFLTTITVRLKSKVSITLQVEYAPKAKADARVVFTLPERSKETEYVRDTLARERAALEAAYAERIDSGVQQGLLLALVEPHQCASASTRVRTDNLVLEVSELCRFGSRVFLRFAVENRSRQTAALGLVAVKGAVGGGEPSELPVIGVKFTQEDLPFNGTAVGVVGVDVGDPTTAVSRFEVSLTERSGKGRVLTAKGLDF